MSADPPTDLLTLSQITKQIPGSRGAKHLHPATITRWILTGTKAMDGTVVRLKATRCGHRWLVAQADLTDFFNALSASVRPSTGTTIYTPNARENAAARAGEMLKKMGA